jgi:hypothetical protein
MASGFGKSFQETPGTAADEREFTMDPSVVGRCDRTGDVGGAHTFALAFVVEPRDGKEERHCGTCKGSAARGNPSGWDRDCTTFAGATSSFASGAAICDGK